MTEKEYIEKIGSSLGFVVYYHSGGIGKPQPGSVVNIHDIPLRVVREATASDVAASREACIKLGEKWDAHDADETPYVLVAAD